MFEQQSSPAWLEFDEAALRTSHQNWRDDNKEGQEMMGDDWTAFYHRWRRIPESTELALVE
jgi:hypothetical protein